jgi:opacity protein-like surface antigen
MLVTLAVTALAMAAATAEAQTFRTPYGDQSRDNKWDMSFRLLSSGSESAGSANGSSIDVDSEVGWGFGFNYNINEHFALGFDFDFVKPRYEAKLIDESQDVTTIRTRLTVSTGQLKGTWNMLKGPLTPYVEAGIGWTYLDSNFPSGPPVTGCWWDPFWGYICNTFYSTYSDTSFAYSGGLGVRWEINPLVFLKGGYRQQRIDLGSRTGDVDLESWRIEVGTSF